MCRNTEIVAIDEPRFGEGGEWIRIFYSEIILETMKFSSIRIFVSRRIEIDIFKICWIKDSFSFSIQFSILNSC